MNQHDLVEILRPHIHKFILEADGESQAANSTVAGNVLHALARECHDGIALDAALARQAQEDSATRTAEDTGNPEEPNDNQSGGDQQPSENNDPAPDPNGPQGGDQEPQQ